MTKNDLVNIPAPMAALALGIATLGVCLEKLHDFSGIAQNITAIISAVLLILLLIKFSLHPGEVKRNLSHRVIGSVLPTFAMAIMVISATVAKLYLNLAIILWLLAIILHVGFLVRFTMHRLKDFQLHHMIPSWFIPPVGIIVAAITFPNIPALLFIADALLVFGIIANAILLPVMLYRLIFLAKITTADQPTFAILAAPVSLCLAGYLTVESNPDPVIASALCGIALLMTVLVYLSFVDLLRLPFSVGYSAFTFPLAISALAMYKMADWMHGNILLDGYATNVKTVANIECIIAILIIVYVSYHYLIMFYSGSHKKL